MKSADDRTHPVVRVLSELIRIDTSNPPGNEEGAVQFIEAILKKEGIKAQVYSPRPRRSNLLARLPGKKPGKPVILLGHLDVVPARDEGWAAPPFGGVVKDGFLYGRGAIDMKSQVVCMLLSFIGLHREGITPERDMIYLATADEETSGELGVEYMLEKVKELRDASFVVSEGGCIVEGAGFTHARVAVAEKKVCQFMLRARGAGGHGSMPHGNNANDKLVLAAERVISARAPLRPTRLVTRYLTGLLKGRKIGGMRFSNLKEALSGKRFLAFVGQDPFINALLRNTVALTMLESGDKVNVIPTEATARFDARILPDVTHEDFLGRMRKIAGPEVELLLTNRTDSKASPYNTRYFRDIGEIVRSMKGDVPVLPSLTTGATDLRHFRNLGIPAYGFFPITLPEEEELRMHGVDERISVANLLEGLKGTEKIVAALASYTEAG
jgi:acetylornithine deacetylase/succinyl-diaminopimelate desuccinylase-like protein